MAYLSRLEVGWGLPDTRARICGDDKNYLFGKAVYLRGGRFGPRIQSVFQLVVMIQGGLRVTLGGVANDLGPGDAILLIPGTPEIYRFAPDIESVHTWCQISPVLLSPVDLRRLRRVRGIHQAPSSIHLLIEEGLAVQDHASAELHGAMAALARACLLRFAAHTSSLDHGKNTAPLHPVLIRAIDFATNHYAELHSAEDLARHVGISAGRLRALCRDASCESPSGMIWRLKVEHAIQLIRSTGLTLGEIADDCGYANPFHLSRSVRRYTGHAPRHLRQGEWKR
jgi:AraC-like DNA-binding protein